MHGVKQDWQDNSTMYKVNIKLPIIGELQKSSPPHACRSKNLHYPFRTLYLVQCFTHSWDKNWLLLQNVITSVVISACISMTPVRGASS